MNNTIQMHIVFSALAIRKQINSDFCGTKIFYLFWPNNAEIGMPVIGMYYCD